VIENYKFDLQSLHQDSYALSLGQLIVLLIANICIHHLPTTQVVFIILEQGLKETKTTFVYTKLPYTTVGNQQVFTSSQLCLWITKTST